MKIKTEGKTKCIRLGHLILEFSGKEVIHYEWEVVSTQIKPIISE